MVRKEKQKMKIKFEVENIRWACDVRPKHSDANGERKPLPSRCELEVDDPDKSVESFPKKDPRPGRWTYMDPRTVSYVMMHLARKYKEVPVSIYVKSVSAA